jgi:hypothetical protein
MRLTLCQKEPYRALSQEISCTHSSPPRVPPSTCKIMCVKASTWDRLPSQLVSRATHIRLAGVIAVLTLSTSPVLGKSNDSCVSNARRSRLHSLNNKRWMQWHPVFFLKISPLMTKSHRHNALINHKLKTKKMKNHRHQKNSTLLLIFLSSKTYKFKCIHCFRTREHCSRSSGIFRFRVRGFENNN